MASLLLPSLLLVLLLTSPTLTASSSSNSTTLTAYEVLESFDFPMGLLPVGALGYDIDRSTGGFNAYLDGECSFSLEGSYDLKYDTTISGFISPGRLSALQGVTVKVLFFWINIIEVLRVGDDLRFSVGIASADFPISNFYVCPRCGCGIDCALVAAGSSDA